MTAKHDCRSKIFSRNVKIKLEDIIELNYRVSEKLKNYNEAGFSISVNVNFIGRQTIEFSSWQEFEKHKWNESNAINSITIVWEFNAILPQYGVPQQHVLVVKMADGLRPEEMLNIVFAGKLENIEEIEKQMYPVVARVDFINYVLGDELLHIVEEWNNGLELQDGEEYVFSEFLAKHRRKFAFAFNYITNFIALICCVKVIVYIINGFGVKMMSQLTIDNICEIIWVSGAAILFYMLINKISQWLANIFFKTLGEQQDRHVFFMNKGDANIQKVVEKKYLKNKFFAIGSVVGTFLLDLACSLICGLIVK
ncbi:MAG: hypothetical protein UHU19_07335 [Lachnospiraceae bacterium]|nr:hypothetical protein [Lachnospiraceae bacterium]